MVFDVISLVLALSMVLLLLDRLAPAARGGERELARFVGAYRRTKRMVACPLARTASCARRYFAGRDDFSEAVAARATFEVV